MAWISIHEHVTGPKLRLLAKQAGCTQNEALGMMVRLWLWSIKNIGQDGLLKSMERYDLAEIINIGLGKTYDPEKIVDAMIDTGWIDEVDGQLFIHGWSDWQRYYYSYAERNKKETERIRKARAKKKETKSAEPEEENQIADTGKMVSGAETDATADPAAAKQKTSKTASKKEFAYTDGFEAFWKVYPRKKEKADTFEKYKARLKDGFDDATLLAAATAYRDECIAKRYEQTYIKLGKTFLSNKLPFMDYITDKSQQMAPVQGTTDINTNDDDPFGDWR